MKARRSFDNCAHAVANPTIAMAIIIIVCVFIYFPFCELILEIEKFETGNHRPSAGNSRKKFRKANFGLRLRAGFAVSNTMGFLPLLPMELVFSQRAESNRK